MIPIFNVVLISDKDENAINKGKHVALFHSSKYSDKLYGNIFVRYKLKRAISFVFAAISEIRSSGFSRFTMDKLTAAVTAFLIAFFIKSNNKKLDQIILTYQII